MLWSNRICVWSLAITLVQCQFQKLVGILNREIEGRNNFEILTDEEYAGYGNGDWEEVQSGRQYCESRPLDVIILIDSSRSISPEEYEIEKDAVKVLVREFWPVNRENTQIALLQYGSVVQVIHRFSDEQNASVIEQKIGQMQHRESGTMAGKAIKISLDQIFQPENGCRDTENQKVKKVIIIITDGIFQDKLAAYQYAKIARDEKDIKIFGIGVGDKDRFRQLNEVSGGAENVFYHDDFSNLLQKISELKVVQFECFDEFKDFCKDEGEPCDHFCLNEKTHYECACQFNYELGPDLHSCHPIEEPPFIIGGHNEHPLLYTENFPAHTSPDRTVVHSVDHTSTAKTSLGSDSREFDHQSNETVDTEESVSEDKGLKVPIIIFVCLLFTAIFIIVIVKIVRNSTNHNTGRFFEYDSGCQR